MWKFLNTVLKSMALEIPHKSISQLTNSFLLLSSRNKRKGTKTVATTCSLDCLTLMMKALRYSETSRTVYLLTLLSIAGDTNSCAGPHNFRKFTCHRNVHSFHSSGSAGKYGTRQGSAPNFGTGC